jgi:hypothetical protein
MLGTFTKCDLSAGEAKLDLVMLTKQMEIHFYGLMDKMRKKVTDIQYQIEPDQRKDNVASMSSTGSKDILNMAQNIAEVTELLHTLHETTDRVVEIVRE